MVDSGDDCKSNGKDTTTGMSAWDEGKIVQHVVVGAIGDGWFGGGRDDGFFRCWAFFPSALSRIPLSFVWWARSGEACGGCWWFWGAEESDNGTTGGVSWSGLFCRCSILTILIPTWFLSIGLYFYHHNHGIRRKLMAVTNQARGCFAAADTLYYFILCQRDLSWPLGLPSTRATITNGGGAITRLRTFRGVDWSILYNINLKILRNPSRVDRFESSRESDSHRMVAVPLWQYKARCKSQPLLEMRNVPKGKQLCYLTWMKAWRC